MLPARRAVWPIVKVTKYAMGDADEPPGMPEEKGRHLRRRFRRLTHPAWLGTIRRTTPVSDVWGVDRGTPVDRYYIERFLEEHRSDIRGRVLEVADTRYTDRYGTGVEHRDVLDIDASNPRATMVADLVAADGIPADHFDCFILTQTLQFIYDTRAAVSHAYRILRPGGVLLVTVPTVSRLDWRLVDYWRFTAASCSVLFGEVFGAEHVSVRSYGNVLTGIAFLTGMAYEELSRRELDANDEYFPLIVTVRGVRQ
jgi:SAM-dependent methyltransferase